MIVQGGEPVTEAMKAEARIWDCFYGLAESRILLCAVELGLADIINNQPNKTITLSGLADSLPVNSPNKDHLYRIMRFLVHMQIFTKVKSESEEEQEEEEERYGMTSAAALLLKDGEKSMYSIVAPTREFAKPWDNLAGLLDGKKTGFEKLYGMSYWEFLAGSPERYKVFDDLMARDTRNFMPHLIRGCGSIFKEIDSLVDVGGGSGTAIREIAKAFPHLKCSLFELPHVIQNAPNDPNVVHIAGDVFKFVPQANAILLKNVLHDWGDEECVKILRQCKQAIVGKNGKVIIVEAVIDLSDDDVFGKTKHFYDMQMMVLAGGKERSKKEFKTLLDAAGFSGYEIIPLQFVQSAIVAYP